MPHVGVVLAIGTEERRLQDSVTIRSWSKRNETGEAVKSSFQVMDVLYGFHLHLFTEHKRSAIRNAFVSIKMVENDPRNGLVRIINEDFVLVKGRMMYPTVMHYQTLMESSNIATLYESNKLPVFLP